MKQADVKSLICINGWIRERTTEKFQNKYFNPLNQSINFTQIKGIKSVFDLIVNVITTVQLKIKKIHTGNMYQQDMNKYSVIIN